ncbi:MAG: MaoC/PaaZ C-terminal domain-containing protein [Desulfatiglans sp.]|jgi:acyl dehydratase|nr:MaoC/PaaZ C-terminal domain-containing protein [Thermodesulfobacteriota bacterium]MEE4353809.1 MaoC/PaaZ C-terminal domain-containing protein [Desulfatiglans sp.]
MKFEDIKVGDPVPGLKQDVTIIGMAMYCGITWDFARQHYDHQFAGTLGYEGPVVDPQMYGAFLARMLTDWIAEKGRIRRLAMRYMAPAYLGDTLSYSGKVAEVSSEQGNRHIRCELFVEEQKGRVIVKGSADVLFF